MIKVYCDKCNKEIEEKERSIIEGLVRGIEEWAREEDNLVHPELWDAYKRAKKILGEKVQLKEDA